MKKMWFKLLTGWSKNAKLRSVMRSKNEIKLLELRQNLSEESSTLLRCLVVDLKEYRRVRKGLIQVNSELKKIKREKKKERISL